MAGCPLGVDRRLNALHSGKLRGTPASRVLVLKVKDLNIVGPAISRSAGRENRVSTGEQWPVDEPSDLRIKIRNDKLSIIITNPL